MKKLFFILLVVVPFLSCEDNEGEIVYYETCIYGNVTNYFSGEPIVGLILDVEYNDEYHGMSFGGSSTQRNLIKAASITDVNDYYSIPIAKKVGVGGSNYTEFDHVVIKPRNNNEDYYFEEGSFEINGVMDSLGTLFYKKNYRSDIRAKSRNDYGFIKLYYNPKDTVSYYTYQGTYSFNNSYIHEFITLDTIQEQNSNYYLIKVPILTDKQINVTKNNYNYESFYFYYTLESRMDTVSFSIL